MAGSPTHLRASWLAQPGFQSVCDALQSAGFVVRAVGGAVREGLRSNQDTGVPVTDIDLATDAPPDDIISAMTHAGLRTIPTGISHGTVTVLTDTGPYEVTTLRSDIETDGRHATVAFTDDWQSDAERRDFTINAIYCDPDGRVFDPVGGTSDLSACRLRFIGDPNIRIAEDYLRILRLFRFYAQLPEFTVSNADLEACTRGRSGLRRLSKERIRAEWFKLLQSPASTRAISGIIERGLWFELMPSVPSLGVFERCKIADRAVTGVQKSAGPHHDPVLLLAALSVQTPEDSKALRASLRLSNAEHEALQALADARPHLASFPWNVDQAARLRYRYDAAGFSQLAKLAFALQSARPDIETLRALSQWSTGWTKPKFPLTGHDAISAGVSPGPAVGKILEKLESDWVCGGFNASTVELKAKLQKLADAQTG